MKFGISLPTSAPFTPPQDITRVAIEAERMGYASVWTFERLLFPVDGGDSVGGGTAPLPPQYAVSYDPIETLAYIAAKTTTIALGISVLDAPFHAPVMLGKRLATLDQFSNGRVIAGLGQGWMQQEFDVMDRSSKLRGPGVEEMIAAMRAVWGPDPVSFSGRHYRIPSSKINPKPVRSWGIPIIMGVVAPAAIARAGRIADGFNPVASTQENLVAQIATFREAATRVNRDPAALPIYVRANTPITLQPMGEGRPFLGGSIDQIARDLESVRALNVQEVFFAFRAAEGASLDDKLALLQQLRQVAEH
jgi:probable F420-dependent oxidoreductase